MKILVDVPDGWNPKDKESRVCPDGCIMGNDCVIKNGEFDPKGQVCPLSNAVKAVEVKQPVYNGERVWTISTPIRLFAVEEK